MVVGLLAWCGLRFGQRTVTLVLVGLAAIAITSKAINLEPFIGKDETPEERLLTIQVYLAVIGGSGLLLAAAYSEAKSTEAQIRAVGDNLPEGAVYQVLRERDGYKSFLYLSAGIERMTGISPAEMMRDPQTYYSMVLEEDKPAYVEAELHAVRHMTPFLATYRIRRRDGEVRWLQSTSSPRPFREGRIIWDGILTDITQARQSEDDLRTARRVSARSLRMHRSPSRCLAINGWSTRAPRSSACSVSKRRAWTAGPLHLRLLRAQSREEIGRRSDRRRMGLPEPREYESVGQRRDGSRVSHSALGKRHRLAGRAGRGRLHHRPHRDAAIRRGARPTRTAASTGAETGSIGRLAGGVAHDFNNLLTVINGFSTLLTQKLDNQSRLWTYADQVRKSGERGASLTRQLLAFSRQEVIKPVNLNLTHHRRFRPHGAAPDGRGYRAGTRLDPDLGHVLADPAQIDQVILNLAANARDAMPHGGRLEISTRNADRDLEGIGGTVGRVTVTDTGVGMDEATNSTSSSRSSPPKVWQRHGIGARDGLRRHATERRLHRRPQRRRLGTSFELCFPRIEQPIALPASKEAVAVLQVLGRANSAGGGRRAGARFPALRTGRARLPCGGGARRTDALDIAAGSATRSIC